MKKRSKPVETPRPQIGDYFAYIGLDGCSVRLMTGPLDDGFFSLRDEHVTKCATLEGARRLAALMNQARDLARDHYLVFEGHGKRDARDTTAEYISRHVARALDVPFRYVAPEEHTRDKLLEWGRQVGDLARFFAFLDAAGTPGTLDDFKARAMLRRHAINDRDCSYCDHDRSREVVRAWRRTFDASVPAADRAAKVLARLSQPEEVVHA